MLVVRKAPSILARIFLRIAKSLSLDLFTRPYLLEVRSPSFAAYRHFYYLV